MANLVFNEAALLNLLEAPNGPYGDRLRLVAEQITGNYNAAIQGVWQNQPASIIPQADYEIERGEFGLTAVIGIVDPGIVRADGKETISQVIANKFDGLESDKFVPKIMADWDTQL